MLQTLRANRSLLLVCGLLNAALAAVYVAMTASDAASAFARERQLVSLAGKLALLGGFFALAAALWTRASRRCWPLAASGAALATLGVVQYGLTRYRIGIVAIALLVLVMAAGAAALFLGVARSFAAERRFSQRSVFGAAAVASLASALPLVACAFRWIEASRAWRPDLLSLAACFAASAAGLLLVAHRVKDPLAPAAHRPLR